MEYIFKKKLVVWFYLTLNILFAFIIGFTIPFRESESRFYLGFVIIPILIVLNFVCLERFQYFLRCAPEEREQSNENYEK
jgi:hypothetical protein